MSKGGHEIKVKELKTVYSAELIAQRVKELAAEIDAHYGQEPLVAVCVLKGGFVFFSHQVGSFMGVWLGGYLYDRTGSYDVVWYIAIGLGIFAGLVNLPVKEAPIQRGTPQPA